MSINKKLLDILACPACKGPVEYKESENKLYCKNSKCALIFPVKDDIPVMLIEEAKKS